MSLFNLSVAHRRVLVVPHGEHSPCGNFCKALEEAEASIEIRWALKGEALPESPEGFAGMVVLGGPQNAFDDEAGPHFPELMELMRRFDRSGKPVAGICLGSQLLARAHGGTFLDLGWLELGFIQHHPTAAATNDPVLGGLILPRLMEFHQDSFNPPEAATLLVEGKKCRSQCFRVGTMSYGFQFHLEVDFNIVKKWLYLFKSGQIQTYAKYMDEFAADFYEDMSANLDSYIEQSAQFCNTVAKRWLHLSTQQ